MLYTSAKNLPFQVIYATSETDSNPASSILDTSPLSNGWLSLPNAAFPQEIIIDFGASVCVSELKFVSHQCKIASNTNILIGSDISNWRKVRFEPLDSFQFTDNKQNNYRAREIRVAHLPMIHLRYIKLSITGCYQNRHNKSNQVGIISIVAKGYSDGEIEEDEEIVKLERLKQEAVDREDFDKAKEIKAKIDNIKDNRTALSELKQRKIDAIRNEDYDLAKRLKYQEEQLLIGDDNFMMPQQPPPRAIPEQKQAFEYSRYQPPQAPIQPAQERQSLSQSMMNPPYGGESELYDDDSRFGDMRNPAIMQRQAPADMYPGSYRQNQYDEQWDERPVGPDFSADDSRPIKPSNGTGTIPTIDDRGDELVELDDVQRREASYIIKVAGEESVRKYYSKSVDLRTAGIKEIAHAIKAIKPASKAVSGYEKFCQLLKPCIKENSNGAFVKAVDEIIKLTDKIKPPVDVVRASIELHKQAIFSKLKNKKVSQTAVEFFRWAAGNSALGVQFVAPIVMAPLKQPIQWTAVLPRLEIIQYLIETYGPIDGCFEIPQIISFVMLPLDSPKPEVRKEAMNVLDMLVELGAKSQIVKIMQDANIPNFKKIIESLDQGR